MAPLVRGFDVGRGGHRARRAPATPACPSCQGEMKPGELRAARRTFGNRAGAPEPPIAVLPIWACDRCGCRQPRLDGLG